MRHTALLCALALAFGCKSAPVDCRDLGLVEGERDNCVCPEPLVPTDDRTSCECPAGTLPSGETCIVGDGGPFDAGADATPPADGCVPVTLYEDRDGDGRGNPSSTRTGCPGLAGFVENANDCDDACEACGSGVDETCDSFDNDCDGYVDEGVRDLVAEPVNLTRSTDGGFGTLATHRIALHALTGGGWLALYVDDSIPDVLSSGVAVAQRLDVEGRPVGSPTPVMDTPSVEDTFLTTTTTEDRILVAFTSGGAVAGRVYSRVDGSPLTPPRTLAEGPAQNLRATALGVSFLLVWERDDTLVYQWRPSFLGDAVDVATEFHPMATNPYLLASTWTHDERGRTTLVFVDGGLRAASFASTVEAPEVREITPPWDLGDPDFVDLGPGTENHFAIASAGTIGFARFESTGLASSTVETATALFGNPLMVDTATFFARRVGGDGEIGVFSYQRMPGGSWRRSPLDLSGGTLGPAYAGGLVLMGQLQPDDSEDAVVRVLGCP